MHRGMPARHVASARQHYMCGVCVPATLHVLVLVHVVLLTRACVPHLQAARGTREVERSHLATWHTGYLAYGGELELNWMQRI